MRLSVVLAVISATVCLAGPARADSIVSNPTFASTNQTFPGYTTATSNQIGGWTGTGSYGATGYNLGGFWNNGTVPSGTNEVGFIQTSGTLSTTLTDLTPGDTYQVNFLYNSRSYAGDQCCNATPYLSVSADGSSILSGLAITPVGGTNSFQNGTATFVADGTSEVLTFTATTNSGADGTALLSNLSVAATPEPSTLALMGTGFFVSAAVLRRRQRL